MASINDGLRPVVRTMVFDTLAEAQEERDRHAEEAPEYRSRVSGRVVKVDGCAVSVWVLVVRHPQVGPSAERARKKAAQTCGRARRWIQHSRHEEIEATREATELLYQAERSALLLDGGL